MKSILKKFVLLFAALIALNLPSAAQDWSSILGSVDNFRQYAMKQGAHGNRQLSSASIDWNDTNRLTSAYADGKCGEDILDALFAVKFRYTPLNSNDNIRAYTYLYDTNYNALFFGYAEYPIGEAPIFTIWMQEIPIMSDVSWAEILVLGADGKTADHLPLKVENGRIKWQWWLCGAPNGILVVYFNDGTTTKYDLWDPTPQSPGSVNDNANSYKVDAHYVYHFGGVKGKVEASGQFPSVGASGGSSGDDLAAVVKIIEANQKPSCFIVTSTKLPITFDVLGLYYEYGTTLFERPTSMDVEDQDTGKWKHIDLINVGSGAVGPVKRIFEAGRYRVVFNWVKFGLPNTIYTGGKGKAALP